MNFFEQASSMLHGRQVIAITCFQWGDTGKGKFVDAFGSWAKVIVRGTGGANAGHTISLNGNESIFHLIPSGILHDAEGKINIIGSGVAFDPGIITDELDMLDDAKMSYGNLLFSNRAHLVLPQHLLLDRLRESKADKIGTTGRGIGPVYTDHYARRGLRLNDLLNKDIFSQKLKANLREIAGLLSLEDSEKIKAILGHEHLGGGRYWSESSLIDADAIVETYVAYADRFTGMIQDTDAIVREALEEGSKVLCEGAQGNLLSIDIGSYPHVTSSDCSVHGLMKGAGLDMSDLDLNLGIVKAPYMTRVGNGPFPTEFGGEKSAEWCAKAAEDEKKKSRKQEELDRFGKVSVNSQDEFLRGIGIRQAGHEFGATTGRCRRTGRLDLPLLRHSIRHSGQEIILTKLDVMDESDVIEICESYTYRGPSYRLGNRIINDGDKIETAITESEVLARCVPNYVVFPGWKTDISGIRTFSDLPQKLIDVIHYIENKTGAVTEILSVGPDREQTIFTEN